MSFWPAASLLNKDFGLNNFDYRVNFVVVAAIARQNLFTRVLRVHTQTLEDGCGDSFQSYGGSF